MWGQEQQWIICVGGKALQAMYSIYSLLCLTSLLPPASPPLPFTNGFCYYWKQGFAGWQKMVALPHSQIVSRDLHVPWNEKHAYCSQMKRLVQNPNYRVDVEATTVSRGSCLAKSRRGTRHNFVSLAQKNTCSVCQLWKRKLGCTHWYCRTFRRF